VLERVLDPAPLVRVQQVQQVRAQQRAQQQWADSAQSQRPLQLWQ
jgi:hypothetical protein